MRSPRPILLLLGAVVPLLPLRAPSAQLCSESLSTAAQTQCLMAELKGRDR